MTHVIRVAGLRFDMHAMSDAEVGAAIRRAWQADEAEQVKVNKPLADAAKASKAEVDADLAKRERAKRKSMRLKGFIVDDAMTVPDLDLTELSGVYEVVPGTLKSIYDQARHRLLSEPALDPEVTTYADLMGEHERLKDMLKARRTRKKSQATIALAVTPETQTKAEKMAEVMDWTVERAAEFLATH